MASSGLIGRFRQQPFENRRYLVDYKTSLQTLEILSTVVFVIDTVTVPPLAITNSTIAVDGKSVTFFVGTGLNGTTYKVSVRATTSTGQKFEDEVEFVVEEL